MKSSLERYRFEVQTGCTVCARPIHGSLSLDERFMVCDSGGFVLLNDGPQCDTCVAGWNPTLASTEPLAWPKDRERITNAITDALTRSGHL